MDNQTLITIAITILVFVGIIVLRAIYLMAAEKEKGDEWRSVSSDKIENLESVVRKIVVCEEKGCGVVLNSVQCTPVNIEFDFGIKRVGFFCPAHKKPFDSVLVERTGTDSRDRFYKKVEVDKAGNIIRPKN